MSSIWIIVAFILGFLIVFQIAKASEYVAILHGEEKTRRDSNRVNGFMLLIFLVAGLFGVWYCNHALKDRILGEAASNHGEKVDTMLYITLAITAVVFVITQIALFWFAYKYQEKEGRKAFYYPHNNKLELIWTVIPAITLTVLIGFGLYYWYAITGEAPKNAQIVEVTGSQFKWEFRYPGADGQLGKKYYREISANNPLGQIWTDPANHDDVVGSQEMHLVVNKPVKLIIGSKDVIHDVGLVHFRMKMDAVPGQPTTMWFTPKFTTREMKQKYGDDFEYEISCDQMCGRGHFSMRGTVVVESQAEFNIWLKKQKSQYATVMEAEKGAPAAPAADSAKNKTTALNAVPVKSIQ
ncbi:cytochrome c oxidase subunit II [Flavisolibacter ginsenosidimutans]|uniref:Cytochrome c oxidase subunit 2 n=1 Tax=Flavisolibacter ginsenosidimutans TaxID=661481 RepID=A0A5B8UM02_9BACT|nr:cytochrome c oxidase subunit II [Flavisolibacter ginsenosidimutans]QEC57372.1 cytochrome c oxidase subunit II [Flavisolibacter ginsenosidimutans]